jgi:hypothetical protein
MSSWTTSCKVNPTALNSVRRCMAMILRGRLQAGKPGLSAMHQATIPIPNNPLAVAVA